MNLSPSDSPIKNATLRGVIGAGLVGGGVFFAGLAAHADPTALVSTTGGAICLQLAVRLGIEGVVDQRRADRGDA